MGGRPQLAPPQQPNLKTRALLERARRVVLRNPADAAGLETAIADLEAAVRIGDEEVIDERSDELLNLLYDMDDE